MNYTYAKPILYTALLSCFAGVASSAGPVTYVVSVNTSSISGTVGSLDLNFNPGPLTSQAASVQILNFVSNGTLVGSPALIGDVNGALPTTVTLDNGTGFNDYFQAIHIGRENCMSGAITSNRSFHACA